MAEGRRAHVQLRSMPSIHNIEGTVHKWRCAPHLAPQIERQTAAGYDCLNGRFPDGHLTGMGPKRPTKLPQSLWPDFVAQHSRYQVGGAWLPQSLRNRLQGQAGGALGEAK
jgi:hypothetical protein